MIPTQVTVIAAHTRSYEDPIRVTAGETVTITRRDLWDDQHLWLWCIAPSGKAGWVPAAYLDSEGPTATISRDYSALELTVTEGETVTRYETQSGWAWCENARGEAGWVPVTCLPSD
ncbi:MAG: SH3 domain-containing protein [Chloroflexota bacterium]